ncbi:hypothetical protein CMUS01_09477 [Colletotrichum musicola]|uniref:Uncharacterized protein n=1 Tax=Colletotrichum musicola TaxID=2175873 RepID=A0A8H6NAE7_9PEZI|nr:hypothetical protein CMUS01_09477 [Colletotrichum musicola]
MTFMIPLPLTAGAQPAYAPAVPGHAKIAHPGSAKSGAETAPGQARSAPRAGPPMKLRAILPQEEENTRPRRRHERGSRATGPRLGGLALSQDHVATSHHTLGSIALVIPSKPFDSGGMNTFYPSTTFFINIPKT